ncbi:MAG: hypothetical protein LBC94_05220 [Desulfovibrio sp.]|nr:hypothetical protein [Desulfovibrio sp.]
MKLFWRRSKFALQAFRGADFQKTRVDQKILAGQLYIFNGNLPWMNAQRRYTLPGTKSPRIQGVLADIIGVQLEVL